MECASEPHGIAAGAGALPGARRRCEAGKRTHGPGPRACLALLAATALLALAAPAQAQTGTHLTNTDSPVLTSAWTAGGPSRFEQAIRFVVGRQHGGYILEEVRLDIRSLDAGAQATVRLHFSTGDSDSASPGNVVATFISPGTLGTGLQTFTAPPNLFVGPSGSYWIVVTSNDIKSITLRRNDPVASHAGSGSRSGWSFHGRSSRSLTAASSWSSASIGSGDTHRHIRVEIRGRLPLWGATLTAGVASVAFTGFASGYGSLSDTDFTYEGTDYTIGALHRSITVFRINLNRTLTAAARNDLTLWLGGTAYPLSSATEESLSSLSGMTYSWFSNIPTFTVGSTYTVRMSTATTAPTVSNVDVTSAPASADTYGTGEMIEFTVTFDQDVTVTGTPKFEFCLGSSSSGSCTAGSPPPTRRRAALTSGSGTTELVFSYTVVVGEVDDNGIWIGDQDHTIKLDTGDAIEGTVGGRAAVLTHREVGAKTGHKVNGAAANTTPPSLVSATVNAAGDQINLVFSEDLVLPASGLVAFLNTIAGSFSVTAAGSPLSIGRVSVTAGNAPHILTLPVSPDIGQGQAVVLSYTDPTAGDDDVALEDALGHETPSFTTGMSGVPAVTNNSTVDLTGPALVSATVNADGDQVELVFSEDLVLPASGLVAFLDTLAGSFSVTAAGSPLSIGRVSVTAGNAPHILTLPVSPDIGQGQAVVLSYTDPTAGDDDVALEDALGHETPSFTTGMSGVPAVTNNSTVDLTGPALVSATVNADGDQVELVFSEDLVLPASGLVAFLDTLAGSFSVTAAGSPLSIGRVSVTAGNAPHILTLPVSPDIGQGQAVVLSYTDPTAGDDDVALEDALGHETPSFTTGMSGVPAVTNNSTVDLTGPALVSATVNADGDQVELVFSEDLVLPASGLVAFLDTLAGSFSVTAAGSPLSIGRVSVTAGNAPHILTLPVSPDIGQGQAVVLSYTDPTAGDDDVALEDAGGNETPSFTTGSGGVPAVTNNSTVDLTGPALVSATVNADGDQVELVFSEDLVLPASGLVAFLDTLAGSFSVTAAGSPLSIGRVSVTAGNAPHILTLPVSPDIGQGQAVVLSYTDPTAGDDDVALEDALGHETPSFTTGMSGVPAVTNNSTVDLTGPALVSATVNADGDQVELVFSEDLVLPASGLVAFLDTLAGSFSVTAAGSPLSIGRVSVTAGNAPHILTLPVSPDIGQGQAVVLSYTDPTAGDDDVALEDALGHETPSFTTGMSGVPAVTNNSTVDLTGPALVSATVNADGDQVELVFSEDLVLPASGLVAFLDTLAGSFSVTAAGSPLSIGRVSVTAGNAPHILTLPVSPDIGQGQAVVLSYTDPTAGDDDVALEDALGHETPSFTTGIRRRARRHQQLHRDQHHGARADQRHGDLNAAQDDGHLRRARAHRVLDDLRRAGDGDRRSDLRLRPRRRVDGDLVCGLGHHHAAVLPRRERRVKRRPGHERDFLGRERDRAQRRHHRGDRQRGGGDPDPRRPAGLAGAQGRRPDDARHARHGHRGGDLDAGLGRHLPFRRDDRDHGHRQRGGGGGGRSGVRVLDEQPGRCRQ